ncbi:MAG TPA: HipA domain-containing protein [Puia sp.]|nr:HipA domain-containing protein [Puia sp.]
MTELAKNVIERSIAVPGVQPKISLTLVQETIDGQKKERLTIVGALGGNYIVKPPSTEFPELPQNEHLTMRIAEIFGIPTVPSSLVRLASGELSYVTRRIDRTVDQEKIHMLDMFQITGATDKYKSSMERIGKALDKYAANTLLDKLRFFEMTVFAFLTGNNDMHLKNFSMITNENGDWALAPAYDMLNVSIVLPADKEELALTLNGKKSKLNRTDFEDLAKGLGLKDRQVRGVFTRFVDSWTLATKWINDSFLSKELKEAYKSMLVERYSRLEVA